jgi:benzoyl-CoA reductase/2-hydroxyglutaryl-CoA dehydratase subunit BcrC/BadD/HgdB
MSQQSSLRNADGSRTSRPTLPESATAALDELSELARQYGVQAIERLVECGEASAVWGGSTWEAPLVYSCGVTPIGFAELWRDYSKEAEAIGESIFQVPSEFCSMIKTIIGRLHLRKDGPIKRILFFGGYCEPAIIFELAKNDGYDLFTIDGVTAFQAEEKRPALISFVVKELQRTAHWLTGKPVDEDRLKAEIQLKNRVIEKTQRIMNLRLKNPLQLPAPRTMQLMAGVNHYYGDDKRYLRILDTVINGLEATAATSENRPFIPLILTGGAVGSPRLIDAVEESNGVIVGWVMSSSTLYRDDLPPLESLAHFLFDSQRKGELGEGAGTSCTNRRFRVEDLIRETGARGIISSSTGGCPYGSIVQQFERTHFKKLGIPTVTLESSVHKEPPTEEQIMKVKTFIEMLS